MKVLSWLIALCGLWEAGDIVLPFVAGFRRVQPFVWSHIVAGIVLVILGARAATTRDLEAARRLTWIATAAGIWLIIAPFILGARAIAGGVWNAILVGAIVVILSSASRLLLRRSA